MFLHAEAHITLPYQLKDRLISQIVLFIFKFVSAKVSRDKSVETDASNDQQ
uniref:Uncharacterized protein n=1 Tax=Anguilla anguilla TaxID=7936 RepID=A0A0E9S943_ANGAN